MDIQCRRGKPRLRGLQSTKVQIRLRIRAVRLAPLLIVFCIVLYLNLLEANFKFSRLYRFESRFVRNPKDRFYRDDAKWASSRENLSSEVWEQQRRRPACASAQSDQRICYSLFKKHHI